MACVQRGNKRYYYRSVRSGGKVNRIYCGTHDVAQDERQTKRNSEKAEKQLFADILATVKLMAKIKNAKTVLAGYHRPNCGPWRKLSQKTKERVQSAARRDLQVYRAQLLDIHQRAQATCTTKTEFPPFLRESIKVLVGYSLAEATKLPNANRPSKFTVFYKPEFPTTELPGARKTVYYIPEKPTILSACSILHSSFPILS